MVTLFKFVLLDQHLEKQIGSYLQALNHGP